MQATLCWLIPVQTGGEPTQPIVIPPGTPPGIWGGAPIHWPGHPEPVIPPPGIWGDPIYPPPGHCQLERTRNIGHRAVSVFQIDLSPRSLSATSKRIAIARIGSSRI
jgi:hypothetical protein